MTTHRLDSNAMSHLTHHSELHHTSNRLPAYLLLTGYLLVFSSSPDSIAFAQASRPEARVQSELQAFCKLAEQHNRGVAMLPFVEGADRLLLVLLSTNGNSVNNDSFGPTSAFREWIGWTEEDGREFAALRDSYTTKLAERAPLPRDVQPSMLDTIDYAASLARERLECTYGAESGTRLLAAYLYTEGFMALRRDGFVCELRLSMYQQIHIRLKVESALGRAMPYHQGAFSRVAGNSKALQEVQEKTRLISRKLDEEILDVLTF